MKKLLFTAFLSLLSIFAIGQNQKYQLSTHILDISKGSPASDISIKLEKFNEQTKTQQFFTSTKMKTVKLYF